MNIMNLTFKCRSVYLSCKLMARCYAEIEKIEHWLWWKKDIINGVLTLRRRKEK